MGAKIEFGRINLEELDFKCSRRRRNDNNISSVLDC